MPEKPMAENLAEDTTGGAAEAGSLPQVDVPDRAPRRIGAKIALSVFGLVIAVLLFEGILSLVAGVSIRTLVEGLPAPMDIRSQTDAERWKAAATNAGLYRVHQDPRVAYVMRANAELTMHDVRFRTDDLGMRCRPGKPERDPFRIVVLGDSVAFGFGVKNDETLAYALERSLRTVRGPDAPPIECHTVAIPGWNHRNAVAFFLDHYDRYDPDIVLYIPVGNDLADSDGIWETGHRRAALDPLSHDPLLHVSVTRHFEFLSRLFRRLAVEGRKVGSAEVGAFLLASDACAESRLRFDGNAASIETLRRRVERRGKKLALVRFSDCSPEATYDWILLERLLDRGVDLPVISLFRRLPKELRLVGDPHANARALDVAGRWLAAELFSRNLVDRGAGRSLDPLPAGWPRCARRRVHRRRFKNSRPAPGGKQPKRYCRRSTSAPGMGARNCSVA